MANGYPESQLKLLKLNAIWKFKDDMNESKNESEQIICST